MKDKRKNILISQHNKCFYCKNTISFGDETAEHLVPESKGGNSHQTNLVVACRRCNILSGYVTTLKEVTLFLRIFLIKTWTIRQRQGRNLYFTFALGVIINLIIGLII